MLVKQNMIMTEPMTLKVKIRKQFYINRAMTNPYSYSTTFEMRFFSFVVESEMDVFFQNIIYREYKSKN